MSQTHLAVMLFALLGALAGCAGGLPAGTAGSFDNIPAADADSGMVIGEVGNSRDRAKAHTELAAAYFGQGRMGVALEEVRLALTAEPNYAPAYNILGLVHMDLRENAQAQQAFERSLQLNPNDADTNHNFGWFLCQNQQEERAIRHFLLAVRNPLYAAPQKSYALAAVCAQRKNNERDALEYLERALRVDPNYLPALISMAQIKYRRGNLEDARITVGRFNKLVEPTAESLWLALRIERKLGDRSAEAGYASQLRRRFAGSPEYQNLQKGRFE